MNWQPCLRILTLLPLVFGFALVFLASAGSAHARGVPEIEPGSASSMIALVTGGILILTDRLRRK